MKNLLFLFLLFLLPLAASADDSGTCGGNLTWTFEESTGTLTISGSGEMENYDDTSAPWGKYCWYIHSIRIGDGVTTIGNNAFHGYSPLTSIEIPNSVTSIGNWALSECYSLASINIPSSVTSIGERAFYRCSSLTSIDIPNSVISIGNASFSECYGLTSVNISYGVMSIGSEAFSGCSSLTSITIPNSVTNIGSSAFSGCSSLTSITIPNSVTNIGDEAYRGCSSLTSITIPNSVTSIGNSAFYDCCRLNSIYCLNPIPPNCYGIRTFESGNVRNKYDIYTYANLHVPMGSKELYGSAYEWRYFEKVKEDMELNGNVYYVNLTVQQGTTGYTRQAIKTGETYSIYIGSLGNNIVNAVTFNGADVTDEIINGYYTTPEIKSESVLTISYEISSSVSSKTLSRVRVTGYDGEIRISNIDEPSDICVYTIDGKLVDNMPSVNGNSIIKVTTGQLYIIKVGNRTYKIAL